MEAVRALLQDRRDGPRLVLLHGPTGVGKTHLLRAAALQAGPSARAALVSDIVRAILDPGLEHPSGGLLIVDDLHVLSHMPVSQREVGRYLERRVRAGGRVLAAFGVPAELPDLMECLGRITSARFVGLRPPTAREMVRIVVSLGAHSGIPVQADAARAIAARCRGDVRLAQGTIARLRFAQSLAG